MVVVGPKKFEPLPLNIINCCARLVPDARNLMPDARTKKIGHARACLVPVLFNRACPCPPGARIISARPITNVLSRRKAQIF